MKGNKKNGVYVYVTEIYGDFLTRPIPLTVQDPVWVSYNLHSGQVRLDQPLLFDISDIKQMQHCFDKSIEDNVELLK